MELFDTHAHFGGTESETAALLERAKAAGVGRVMAVGGDETLNAGALAAVRIADGDPVRFPKVRAAIGWACDCAGKPAPELDYPGNVSAVGEIGLDYHYTPETREAQMALMARQLETARRLDLPAIVHTREADDDTLALLRETPVRGIAHSFTGSPDFCRALLDLGFYISISGIVTFKAADNVRETALIVPDDRLLVETDTPYLAPVPKRGRPNEPAFVVHTLEFLAKLRGVAPESLAARTTANAELFFGAAEPALR
jgi:TatD DNase family protein